MIQLLFAVMFVFSLALNIWHYKNFVKRVFLAHTNVKQVTIQDTSCTWYSQNHVLIAHAGVYGGGINI